MVTSAWIDAAPAALEAWHLGTEAPAAIVDVLTGAAEPAGRLPMSFPRSAGQVPIYYAHEHRASRFGLGTEQLGFWDTEANRARSTGESGTFTLYIGGSLHSTQKLTFEVV